MTSAVNIGRAYFVVRAFFARGVRKREQSAYERGLSLLADGLLDAAGKEFERAFESAADLFSRAAAANKRGVAAARAGDVDEAEAWFVRALGAQPRLAAAFVNLGNLRLEAGRIDAAIAHYEIALQYDRENALAHLNLGIALKRCGRRREGIAHLRTATKLDMRVGGRRPALASRTRRDPRNA
jgi:tetratricopeptide (TPR) repeat protein